MQFTIIGNPENRRVIAFCAALKRLGYSDPNIISYADWLSGKQRPSISPESIVKIESPGENETVRTLLVARGRGVSTTKPAEHGEIKEMRAWYAGYCSWLQEMQTLMQEQPAMRVMNDPADIQLQFKEVSPATVTREKLSLLNEQGVDRISMGVQSFFENEVKALGRPQENKEVYAALDLLKQNPFATINIDLIYGA